MTNFIFVLIDDETAKQNQVDEVQLKCAAAEFENIGDAAADYLFSTLGLERLTEVAPKVVFGEGGNTAFLRHATATIHGVYIFPATQEEVDSGEKIVALLEKYFPEDFGDPPPVH